MTASAHPGCRCSDPDFCQWAGTCADCRPGQWREFRPAAPRRGGSHGGASYEVARASLKALAVRYRELADEIEQAYRDGFRLYDVSDYGVVHAAKGRVKS